MNKSLTIVLFLALATLAGSVVAGPLNQNVVSGKADWLAHLDLERLNNTEIGQMGRRHLEQIGEAAKLDAFKTVFSFHPLDDIRSVTIFGQGSDQSKASAVFQANFNQETLLALLRLNATFRETAYGNHQIRSWIDEKHQGNESNRQYGSFHGRNRIVLGQSLDAIKHVLDVLDGNAENARAKGQFSLGRRGAARDAIAVAAVAGVGSIAQQWEQAVMLKNAEQLSLIVGEAEGKLFAEVNLLTGSQETAQELMQIIQGMMAWLRLAGGSQPELIELANALNVTMRNNLVRVRAEADVMGAAMFLKAQWDKNRPQ